MAAALRPEANLVLAGIVKTVNIEVAVALAIVALIR
jgi:hypothetical protein